jgi:hypothetical protein
MVFLGGVKNATWTNNEIFSAFRYRASDHKEVFVGGLTIFHYGGVKPLCIIIIIMMQPSIF